MARSRLSFAGRDADVPFMRIATNPRTRRALRACVAQGPVLAFVFLLATVAILFTVGAAQDAARRRAMDQQVSTARVFISLSVDRNFTEADYASGHMAPEEQADLDEDVRVLKERGELVGLEVWDRQGKLLYADPGHPPIEDALPEHELRQALLGKPFVVTADGAERGVSVIEVFQPADPRRDGSVEGVIEVLLPDSSVTSAVSSATRRLYAAGTAMVVLIGWVLARFRRKLRRRDHDAEHDPLTGLGNRTLLVRHAAHAERGALLLADLDEFKRVNDALGHSVGDGVLVAVAARLRGVLRADDLLVRLGGDEFAVLLHGAGSGEDVARRLVGALREPVSVGPVTVQVDVSIGIADRGAGMGLEEQLRRADVAMYQAKRQGCGCVRYSPDSDDSDAEGLTLLGDVQQAIAADEFVLHYQPKVDGSGCLVGVEALVRWMHPARGLLHPGAFLPLMEETALMKPLTAWVLRHAMAQSAVWRERGQDVPTSVNVSPRTLLDAEFVPMVTASLAKHRLPGTSLIIEVTETAILADPEGARLALQALRELGVGVSIDDFGSGFTSLAHLKNLPISEIKIDRGFVQGVLGGGADCSIVAYTVRLAHDLGVPVVAEGVEDDATLNALTALGCDQFQGYLIARPLEAAHFDMWSEEAAKRKQTRSTALLPAAAPFQDMPLVTCSFGVEAVAGG